MHIRSAILTMRSVALCLLLTLLRAVRCLPDEYTPFSDPLFGLSDEALLVKRQNCKSGGTSCSNLGADSVCCPAGTTCTVDGANHVACCSLNAVCTGTIAGTVIGNGGTTPSSSSGGPVLGGPTTTSTTYFPGVTSGTTAGVFGGGSTVANAQYPFTYIATSYANAGLCSTAWSECQAQSTSCFTSLAGQFGVTVAGLGGGITVQGATGTVLSSASSICSSLSAIGCYGLQETQCSIFGSGSVGPVTATTGFVQVGGSGLRPTACPGMLYAAGAGAVFGAIGGLV